MMTLFRKNGRTILLVLVVSLFVCLFSFGTFDSAHAQTAPQTGSQATVVKTDSSLGFLSSMGTILGNFILYIGSYFTWFGGEALRMSIEHFVLNISNNIGTGSAIGTSITTIWGLVRDICNLAFIFGFIYVGIRTIIDADSSATKRALASIIIAAFLINFSLLISKIVIDVGNYVAVEIYNTTMAGQDVSYRIGQILGITTFYKLGNPTVQQAVVDQNKGGNIAFYFMTTILLIVAGFVLAAGALLLMVRFVALILILCFSPILFATMIFPSTKSISEDLWKKLINYSLFAPAYLLMLTVSIRLLDGVNQALNPGNAGFDTALRGVGGNFSTILAFGVAIFFLVMSLQISRKFGIVGGDKAIAFGRQMRGYGQRALGNATFGLGAAGLRATVGRAGDKVSDSDRLKDRASQRGFRGWAARQTLKGSRVIADSSFDARKVSGMGGKLGIGEGAKGGYQTQLKEIKKKEGEFAKSLGEVEDDDVQVMARKKEWESSLRNQKAEAVRIREEMKKAPTPADRARLQAELDGLEDKVKDAQIAYEKEKQRRVIGSTFSEPSKKDKPEVDRLNSEMKLKKNIIKNGWEAYVAMPETSPAEMAAKKTARDNIAHTMEQLKKQKDELADLLKNQRDRGYAGVLEKEQPWTSWPTGRSTWDNRKAGKEIRKNAEKGLPKKKDE